jgi:hypothetical protein
MLVGMINKKLTRYFEEGTIYYLRMLQAPEVQKELGEFLSLRRFLAHYAAPATVKCVKQSHDNQYP